MREFTPGKWKVLKNEKYPFWYVRQEGMESVIATANAEADARLIAAAP